MSAYSCMGAYYWDKLWDKLNWVPIFIGCLFLMGAYYPDSTVHIHHLRKYGEWNGTSSKCRVPVFETEFGAGITVIIGTAPSNTITGNDFRYYNS